MQELLAIQQQGPRAIGFFGTRNMGFMHQELIEILSYALVITVRCYVFKFFCILFHMWHRECFLHVEVHGASLSLISEKIYMFAVKIVLFLTSLLNCLQKNHIYTSGASGTNAAVIRGALRAEKPELLTVILPQSLKKQPPESQELLEKVCGNSI